MTTENREWLPVKEWLSRNPHFGRLNFVYEKVADQTLKSIKVGAKILIASDALELIAAETDSEEGRRASQGNDALTSDSR